MLKVYDSSHIFLAILADGLRNVYTTETLETGVKTLCFQIPCQEEYLSIISEENYIETADYEYIIKELVLEDNGFFTVYCAPNIEEITGYVYRIFDVYMLNPQQAFQYCLSQIPTWSVEYHSTDNTALTLQTEMVSAMDMIRELQAQTHQELWFDTKNKVLHVYDKMGAAATFTYYSNEIKLKRLSKQSSTYDYATVLYPIGKDGLTISLVNNGSPFIENYNYTNKQIVKVWRNEEFDVAERLRGAAEDYLDTIAQPQASYKMQLSELNANTTLGSTIILVDNIKKIKQKQRVVQIIRYPHEPERDNVELSNLHGNFARTFIKQQRVTEKELKYIKKILEEITGQN